MEQRATAALIGVAALAIPVVAYLALRERSEPPPPPRPIPQAAPATPTVDPSWRLPEEKPAPTAATNTRDRVVVSPASSGWKFAPAYQPGQSAVQLYAQLQGRTVTLQDSTMVAALAEVLSR